MDNFKSNLEKYADLFVKVGVNVQKGQKLVISAALEAMELVRIVARKAYEAGARDVLVEWLDGQLDVIRFLNAPDEAFLDFPMWKAKGYAEMAKNGAAFLGISAPNPDLLKDVDPVKTAVWSKTKAIAMSEYYKYAMSGKVNFSRALFASKEWADKVFPDISEEKRLNKLWEYIFMFTKVNLPNPIKAWEEQNQANYSRIKYLNSKSYKKLFYRSEGTKLTVELPDMQKWISGISTTTDNIDFMPSIPCEKIFTAPLKTGTSGVVRSTKPINYRGQVIENFSFTFENGKVVAYTAEKGHEALEIMLGIDEGASFLGEVSIIPHGQDTAESNVIFYDALFDESASCHFALGKVYPLLIANGDKMNKEDLKRNNFNVSLSHIDFMIGSADLCIDGLTQDGKVEPIFVNGQWAI